MSPKSKTYLRVFGQRKAKDGRTIGWPETWAGQQGKLEVPAQAWLSVQPHVLGSRMAIEDFLKARGLVVQVFRFWNLDEQGRSFGSVGADHHGLLRFRLIEAAREPAMFPIPTITPDVLEHGSDEQPPSVPLTYKDITGVTLAGRPQNVSSGDNRMMHPSGFSMLSATSKMETWSFNVPAGPKALGGTCPGSAFAFPFSTPREVSGGLSALAKKGLLPADVADEKNAVERFVCGACVTGDTRILVRVGSDVAEVPIAELEGRTVELWSGFAWRMGRVMTTGTRPTFELRTRCGRSLRLTPDHLVATAGSEAEGTKSPVWVPAGELRKDVPLLHGDPRWEGAQSLQFVESVQDTGREELVYDVMDVEEDHSFWANGITVHNCYAIKGNYGNPSNIWAIQLRLHVVERLLAMPSKQGLSSALADVLVLTVYCGNERAKQDIEALARRKKGPLGRLDFADRPNPGFFRIHDAGDMFSGKYFQAWLDVCQHFDTGDANHIWFWAPTRVWMTGILKPELMRDVPRNLALRPSGLFFRDPNFPSPSPARRADGGGFSAASVAGPHDTDAPPGYWNCPASKGPEEKGGALRDPKTGLLSDSSCARAYGPNDEPHCRACWTHHDKVIVYKEH